MPRLRTLKPEFFTHEVLAELSPCDRLFYQGLWCWADKRGRLEERPKFLKTVVLPYDDYDPVGGIDRLAAKGFLRRYTAKGLRLIWIPAFEKHQKPHPRERESILPPIDEADPEPPETTKAMPSREKVMPRQDLGIAQPGKGPAEPGGLGGFCLGDLGLGDLKPVASAQCAPATPAKQRRRDRPPPNPRHTPLKNALKAEYLALTGEAYFDQGAEDAKGVAKLLAQASDEEILRRWRTAIGRTGFERPRSFTDFASKWALYREAPPLRAGPIADDGAADRQAKFNARVWANGPPHTSFGDCQCKVCKPKVFSVEARNAH